MMGLRRSKGSGGQVEKDVAFDETAIIVEKQRAQRLAGNDDARA